jgi:hypothetical protein
MGFHECNVVGVLVCGHTYHTECLEQITPQSSRQDPACPRCNSEKVILKKPMASMPTVPKIGTVRGSSFMSRPSPRNKLSRVGVLDDSFRKPRFLTSSPEEPSPWPVTSVTKVLEELNLWLVSWTRLHSEQELQITYSLESWGRGSLSVDSIEVCFRPVHLEVFTASGSSGPYTYTH